MLVNDWEQTFWEDDQGNRTTITHLRRTTTEPDRKEKADLSFPIVVTAKDGEFQTILDGNHRLQKAIDKGVTHISAKILKDSNIDQ
jgi:hypothetical protein